MSTNNNNRNDKDVIYNSENDRNNKNVKVEADGTTYKDGDKVHGRDHDKVVEDRHVHKEEPKKSGPWKWLIPLLLLLLLAVLAFQFCDKEDDGAKDDVNTDINDDTDNDENEDDTTEDEKSKEDKEASAAKFDLASIVNFDLAS